MKQTRSFFHITESILQCVQYEPQLKTHIMYRCNLNSKQVQEYLSTLTSKGYVAFTEEKDGNQHGKYTITDKGRKYLKHFAEIRSAITI